MEVGLRAGSKVAVIGGGITGAAMAAALLYSARCRGRSLDVQLFEGGGESEGAGAPVLLTPECRSRLAALGCRIAPEWKVAELRGLEVLRDGHSELLPFSQPVWVVDDWPQGESGRELTARSLGAVAALHGARFVQRRVERVERHPVPPPDDGPLPRGSLVVRAGGVAERFHAVALATGPTNELADAFFPGFRMAPTVPAAMARIRLPQARGQEPAIARLLLWPLPGIEGLYLIPCGQSLHALAWGESLVPADLCQALMMAARDGHLPEGFELSQLSLTRVARGVGRKLTAPGRVAVGPAALGHPLQLGLADALASCSRAAIALVDAAHDGAALRHRYLKDGISDLREDACDAVAALKWLRRAGPRSLKALRTARQLSLATFGAGAGILGLPGPSPRALLSHARRAGLAQWLEDSVWPVLPSVLPDARPERNLFYVVDDDADMREALTSYLEDRGAEVVCFSDELALYCAVARRPPTAILLDVVLKWVDGLRLCEGLKRHPMTRASRVFVMSGLDRAHIRLRAMEAGAEGFFPKPLDADLLWERLSGEGQVVSETPAVHPERSAAGA